jgi:hypothetical protein
MTGTFWDQTQNSLKRMMAEYFENVKDDKLPWEKDENAKKY